MKLNRIIEMIIFGNNYLTYVASKAQVISPQLQTKYES
jgi:hypothetical protein